MKNEAWLRVYERFIDSPQILELSDAEFRLVVSLWCLASSQEVRGTLPYSAKALQRRILPSRSVNTVIAMLDHLIALELLEPTEEGYAIPKWDQHQYVFVSHTPEARRAQKAKERDVASMSQACRNDVAPVEEERDLEKETTTPPSTRPPAIMPAPTHEATPMARPELAALTERVAQQAHLAPHDRADLETVLNQQLALFSPERLEEEARNFHLWRQQPRVSVEPSVLMLKKFLANTKPRASPPRPEVIHNPPDLDGLDDEMRQRAIAAQQFLYDTERLGYRNGRKIPAPRKRSPDHELAWKKLG